MGKYSSELRQQFELIADNKDAAMDDLMAVYDEAYISLTESFLLCADEVYADQTRLQMPNDPSDDTLTWDDIHGKDPEELLAYTHTSDGSGHEPSAEVHDYFDTIKALCDYDPESFNFEGVDLQMLRDAFKETLMLANSHIHEKLAFRVIDAGVRDLYYETVETLDRTLESI